MNFTYPKLATQIIMLLIAHEGLFPDRETEWTVEELANNFRTFREAVITTALEMRKFGIYEKIPHQDIVEGGTSEPWDEETWKAFLKMEADSEQRLAGG